MSSSYAVNISTVNQTEGANITELYPSSSGTSGISIYLRSRTVLSVVRYVNMINMLAFVKIHKPKTGSLVYQDIESVLG